MSGPEIDRRVTLQWLAGAIAAGSVPLNGAYAAPPTTGGDWPSVTVPPVTAPGYGTDPTMLEPVVPWPKTLTAAQLDTAAALCDTILPAEGQWPAPSTIGIHHFVNEWVSAPYPDQQADRATLLAGFAWVEREARRQHGRGYAQLGEAQRGAILTAAAAADPKGKAFLDKMKFLTAGAYYTSEPGIEELGYIGNVPLEGDYPGPSAEALAHLDQVLASLNLKRKS
ncbi:gluconate 2-dehydrogenase subunit 3 family protein [Sphingomonas piscis]|uniref:Gluconate 2-dehydrogenase subunit 3 family protein n=1 Tax=Sphingomonas piscis TaxID=2714943 RepID=A0A6G7YNG1_9SPHN|nr:gluconate 2-dehydrogenase subunit 3 family protein [Sphingomonas piscis]QIK78267.1 gluconate 2-dehydrogenase subunit 3 family protein [Sphingomonas piscis]